jgi:hypothetical protein
MVEAMFPGGPAVVRRIDHVNVVVPDRLGFFRLLTEQFELPVAWPFTRFPSFESGAAGLGINIEAVRYAPGRPSPVREDAGLYAIACEPVLAEARGELARREIPHSPPLRFTGATPRLRTRRCSTSTRTGIASFGLWSSSAA